MTDPAEPGTDLRSFTNPMDERMGIEVLEAVPERVVGRMPVEGNTQPFGLLHGGASCVLAESLGSLAAGPARGGSRSASISTPRTTGACGPGGSPGW